MKLKTFALIALLAWMNSAGASNTQPYDAKANPKADFAVASNEARNAGKKVLVIFGANWCSDCRAFDRQLQQEPLKSLVQNQFVVVKADVGNWDRNMDFADHFDNPAREGIPSIAVVDQRRELYYATRGRELAVARNQPLNHLADWLNVLAAGQPERKSLKAGLGRTPLATRRM